MCSTHAYNININNLGSDATVGFRSNFKKFPTRTQDHVMHSNERGECDLRTLVDRQRKRYDNAVDVVIRLHDPTDQAPKLQHLRVLAHVQLDDDPRTPIQQSVGEEFRQHNGVVTILMFYRRRASPKHRYNIIEDYGGRGHRTRLRKRSRGSTCVFRGAPCPPI